MEEPFPILQLMDQASAETRVLESDGAGNQMTSPISSGASLTRSVSRISFRRPMPKG